MGGFFGVASKKACRTDLFYGVDYNSHLTDSRSRLKACVFHPQVPDQRLVVFLHQDPDHKCVLQFWIIIHYRYSQIDNQE